MTKKHVSLLVVFVLLFTTLFSSFVFAADEEWVVADDITITAKAHVQSFGDMAPVVDKGAVAFGTEGKAKRLEKFEITLEGAPADMELVGMAHVQSYGDMPKTGFKAGAIGTSGEAKRIEGIAFKLVKKGTDTPYPGYRVAYAVHMQSFGWGISDKVNAVVGKNFDGAEDFAYDGQFAGTRGLAKRVEAVSLIIYRKAELKVEGVSVTNLKEAVIKFNNKLDKDTVVKANFKLNDSSLASGDAVALNEDGTSVTLTVASKFAQQAKVKVTVDGVKDIYGNVVEDITVETTAWDVTIPKAIKAEQVGPSRLKVTISEPIDNSTPVTTANLKVDNGQYFIDGSSITVSGNTITFDLYTTLPVGEHKVLVTGIKDYAGYSVVDTELPFTAVKDEVAPTFVKVVSATPDYAVLEFSENITIIDSTAAKYYHTNSGNTVDSVQVVNGKQLKLTFNTHKLPNGTAYLYIAKEVIADGWNNKNAEIKALAIQVVADTTKPEVKDVKAITDQKIQVTFTEDVDPSNLGTYKVLDAAGKEVTSPAITGVGLASSKTDVVELTFGAALPGSTYTLVIEKVKDAAGNEIDKVTKAVAVTDTTAPQVADLVAGSGSSADGYLYTSKKIVKIGFNEPMKSEDLLNLANYQYGGEYLSGKKVSASVADNGKAVLLDFSKESGITLANGDTITVGKMRDVAGNSMASFSVVVTLVDQDATGIAISKAEATGTKTIVVTLADSLSNFDANDFEIWNKEATPAQLAKASVTFANVEGKGVITFTLRDEIDTDATLASSTNGIEVRTKAASEIKSTNAYGVKVAGSATKDVVDKIGPAFKTVAFANANIIEIVFTEAMDETTLSKYTFTVSGNTVTGFAYNSTTNTATLTLKDNVATGSKVTVTQVLDIEDSLHNVTKGLTKEITR